MRPAAQGPRQGREGFGHVRHPRPSSTSTPPARNPAELRRQALAQGRKLRHRGPDWSGVYSDEHAILAHERLAIVDVEHGAQPLVDPRRRARCWRSTARSTTTASCGAALRRDRTPSRRAPTAR